MAKMLIVDDAKLIQEKLSAILINQDHEVISTAGNGRDGVALYKKLRPDLVTLDITMPIMDGMQALREIMTFDPNANVIICSAMGQQRLVVDAIELGAKDFIIKPFDEYRVVETIHSVLALHGNNE